jgi:gluconolactonase
MTKYFKSAALLFLFTSGAAFSQNLADTNIVAKGVTPKLISSQFSFTEGPAVDKAGNIFFTDQPNNKIWKYDVDGKLSLFLDSAGRSNGTYFDKKGNLIACADENDQLWQISPKGKVTVLINLYKGKHLNGPNDLWIDAKGGIYITDPYYQRDYWTRKATELDGEKVYYLPKGKKELVLVADGFIKPNGIVGSPDGKTMYIADIRANKIYKYQINADASLSNKQVFVNQGADGITLDNRGNLYLAGNGVTVYNPRGQKILYIDVPAKWTANICFGGKDRSVLFMTASEAIYIIPTLVKGVE